MLSTYLSPAGRMSPSDFKNSALMLIVVGVLLSIPELLGFKTSNLAAMVSLALTYCWIVIWIKRYHDGGRSGWLCLLPIVVWLIASILLFFPVLGINILCFRDDPTLQQCGIKDRMVIDALNNLLEAAGTGASEADMEKLTTKLYAGKEMTMLLAQTALSAVVALGFNQYLISNDDHENQYGPVT